LCVGLGILSKELAVSVRKMNEYRNHTAHNLEFRLGAQQRKDFFYSFPEHGRELILEFPGATGKRAIEDVPLWQMVKVIIILLDLERQKYLKWKEGREAAFANARRVLAELKGEEVQPTTDPD
jgi:hypothetical protein